MIETLKRKINTLNTTPRAFWHWLSKQSFFSYFPDKVALKIQYANIFNKKLDLNNPQAFNEKLQWMKLYDRNPLYSILVDKAEVKKYVADIIGEEYIIPTLGVYDNWNEIDFNMLPNEFVIKCTHGSGDVVICKDKNDFDFINAKSKIETSLKKNYYKVAREWAYKNVKPRIIIEKYISELGELSLKDYKFFTFDGKCELFFIASDRGVKGTTVKFDFFDKNCKWLPIQNTHPNLYANEKFEIPKNYDKMINIVEKLSSKFYHIRVDLYNSNGKIYFGELTIYHGGGYLPFTPDEWDKKIGDYLKLPNNKSI